MKLTGTGVAMWNSYSMPISTGGAALTLSLTGSGIDGLWLEQVSFPPTFARNLGAYGQFALADSATTTVDVLFARDAAHATPWAVAELVDPTPRGWSYQTFGWWYDQTNTDDLYPIGAFSVGAATPGASIPTTGSAVFSGKLAGYIDNPSIQEIAAPMSLSVSFSGRSAVFSSSDWWRNGAVTPGTALSGTLTYAAQQNQLTGTLTTANGQLTGPATAQFYGPAAEEVGGTIFLTNGQAQPTRVVAGFGAAR